MTWRLYLVPVVETTDPDDGKITRLPKYIAALPVSWSAQDYGFEPAMLVAADVTTAQHNSISGNADVSAVPVNLDANPNNNGATSVRNRLEALNIPAAWVNTSLTWRQIVRTVSGFMQYMQRVAAIRGVPMARLFSGGVTLSTQINQLPQVWRDALIQAANEFGYDISGLSGGSTLRNALKAMADQWGTRPLVMGGLTI